MRISPFVLASLAASPVAAQQQVPLADRLRGWYDEAQSYLSQAAAAAASHIPTADAAAAKVAAHSVHELTLQNWQTTLQHSGAGAPKPEHWLVYVTGGNRTCHGRCGGADLAWNESVAVLAADATAPKLGKVQCENEEVLCGAWATNVPSLWYLLLPAGGSGVGDTRTPIKLFGLNATTVTAQDILRVHKDKLWAEQAEYEGALHPFDGWVARWGLTLPMAYALWGFGKVPSWAMMIVISMFSRSFTSRRMPQGGRPAAAGAAGGAPAAARS